MLHRTPLAGIETVLENYISQIYRKTLADLLLTLGAILVLAVGAGLFLYALERGRRAYLSRRTSRRTFHYVFMAITVLFVIFRFTGDLRTPGWIFAAASAVSCAVGIFGLVTWRPFGVVFSLLSVWISLPIGELTTVLAAVSDVQNLYSFAPESRIAVLAAQNYTIGRMAALAVYAAVVSAVMIDYYAKRRYLFRTAQAKYFTGISLCPSCGMPVIAGDAHCTACGEDVSDRPGSTLKWTPLDKVVHCSVCGSQLNEQGDCRRCGSGPMTAKKIAKQAGGTLKDELKKKLWYVLVPIILIIPTFLFRPIASLTKGSAAVTNDFTTRLLEWYAEPSVAEDAAWMSEFDRATEALTAFNARTFEQDPSKFSYYDFYVYIQYSEATYRQNAAVQALNEAVHDSDDSQIGALAAVFDDSIDQQLRAQRSGINLLGGSALRGSANLLIDPIRFYMGLAPAYVLPAVLFALGLAGLIAGIILLAKRKNGSPFVYAALDPDTTPEARATAEKKRRSFLRMERTATLIGIGIAALIILITGAVALANRVNEKPTAESAAAYGFVADGGTVVGWLSLCETDPDEAQKQIDSILPVVEDCAERMNTIISDPEADPRLLSVAEQLAPKLAGLRETLRTGALPDQALRKTLAGLFKDGMKLYEQMLFTDMFDQLNDL